MCLKRIRVSVGTVPLGTAGHAILLSHRAGVWWVTHCTKEGCSSLIDYANNAGQKACKAETGICIVLRGNCLSGRIYIQSGSVLSEPGAIGPPGYPNVTLAFSRVRFDVSI